MKRRLGEPRLDLSRTPRVTLSVMLERALFARDIVGTRCARHPRNGEKRAVDRRVRPSDPHVRAWFDGLVTAPREECDPGDDRGAFRPSERRP